MTAVFGIDLTVIFYVLTEKMSSKLSQFGSYNYSTHGNYLNVKNVQHPTLVWVVQCWASSHQSSLWTLRGCRHNRKR